MHAVVLEHVRQVVGLQQVVDANDFDVAEVLNSRAQHVAADAAEAVDTNLDRHSLSFSKVDSGTNMSYLRLSAASTVAATFSSVKPKCLNSTGAGADSP